MWIKIVKQILNSWLSKTFSLLICHFHNIGLYYLTIELASQSISSIRRTSRIIKHLRQFLSELSLKVSREIAGRIGYLFMMAYLKIIQCHSKKFLLFQSEDIFWLISKISSVFQMVFKTTAFKILLNFFPFCNRNWNWLKIADESKCWSIYKQWTVPNIRFTLLCSFCQYKR